MGLRTRIIVQDYNREYIAPDGTFFGHYDGIFFGLETPFPDAHDYVSSVLHAQSCRNHAGVSDPQLDAMIDGDGTTIDEADRLQQVKDILRCANQRMYYVPSFIGPGHIALQPREKGYKYRTNDGDGTETGLGVWMDRRAVAAQGAAPPDGG